MSDHVNQADVPNTGPGPGPHRPDTVEHATEDLLIERPDLGPGCHTLVIAGEAIPKQHADRPRQPLHAATKAKRRP